VEQRDCPNDGDSTQEEGHGPVAPLRRHNKAVPPCTLLPTGEPAGLAATAAHTTDQTSTEHLCLPQHGEWMGEWVNEWVNEWVFKINKHVLPVYCLIYEYFSIE